MKTVILFLLFFIVFPIFISSLRTIRSLLLGPRDDSLYSQQMYEEFNRRAVRELIITYVVFLVVGGFIAFLILQSMD